MNSGAAQPPPMNTPLNLGAGRGQSILLILIWSAIETFLVARFQTIHFMIAGLLAVSASAQEPSAPGAVEGPVIRSHQFQGRTWIPSQHLEAQLGLPPGSIYRPLAVTEALERLLSFHLIEAAGPPEVRFIESGRAVELTWPIQERPLVLGVSLYLPPGRRKAPRELLDSLRTQVGNPLIQSDLQEDRETIRKKYIQEGRSLCTVQSETQEIAPGAAEVLFLIERGPVVTVRKLEITGNRAIPRRHILAAIQTRRRFLFGFFSRGLFDPEIYEEDLERIRSLYRDRGYLEAMVVADPPRFSRDFSRVDLAIQIEEGPRYTLQAVKIRGNGPGIPTELLMRQVRTPIGEPYDGKSLEEDRRRLFLWYDGHYDMIPRIQLRRQYVFEPDDHRVTAVFEIDEREHFLVGRVDIRGNLRTRDRVIRSALAVRPGDPLTALGLERSRFQLAALGYFEPETIEVIPQETGEIRDVEVQVEERKAGLFQIGGGASTGEGEVGLIRITQPNFDLFAIPGINRSLSEGFTGGGQLLEFEYVPGTRQSFITLRFEEPYLYNTDHSISILADTQAYDRRGYDETRFGGEIFLRRFWDRRHRFSTRLGFHLEDVRISNISSDAPVDVTRSRGHTLLSYPLIRLTYNTTEIDPHSGPAGFLAEARGDLSTGATGSEPEFFRTRLTADLYQPVSAWINALLPGDPLSEEPRRRHILRLGAQFGWAEGVDGDEVPIFERFFPGGPRSFRGFDYRGVGPEANGVRLGGNAYFQGTVEYSFPLIIPELRAVALFEFADVESELSRLSTGRIRTSAGGGLRIRLHDVFGRFKEYIPVIPINFYWMEALKRESGDDARFFTFTLGLGF